MYKKISNMITEEKINSNFMLWMECLRKYNCFSDRMIDEIGQKIKVASFAMDDKCGISYKGSLINTVLTKLCTIATHINQCFGTNEKGKRQHPLLNVNQESLMRVLLLQHISKCEIFSPTDDQWKIKRGIYYDFNNERTTQLKLGELSAYMCLRYGIELTEEEYEAMKIIDKTDEKITPFITPLSYIVKISNDLTNIEAFKENGE